MIVQANYDGLGPVVITGGKRDMQWPVPNYPNIQSCFYDHRNHRAIDIAAPSGTPVVAAYPGTVVEVYSEELDRKQAMETMLSFNIPIPLQVEI